MMLAQTRIGVGMMQTIIAKITLVVAAETDDDLKDTLREVHDALCGVCLPGNAIVTDVDCAKQQDMWDENDSGVQELQRQLSEWF